MRIFKIGSRFIGFRSPVIVEKQPREWVAVFRHQDGKTDETLYVQAYTRRDAKNLAWKQYYKYADESRTPKLESLEVKPELSMQEYQSILGDDDLVTQE